MTDKVKTLTDDDLIRAYLQARQKKEADDKTYKEQQTPLLELMAALEGEAQRRMIEGGTTGFKSTHGTCYSSNQVSVTTKNKSAFFEWLTDTGKWELADVRPAKKEIQNFAENTNGDLPPGVDMSQRIVARFRSPTNK